MSSTPAPAPAGLAVAARWERPLVPTTGGEATLLVRITPAPATPAAGPSRRAPVDVAFVLDRSGSMAGEKLALVKEAVGVASGHLRDDDRVALVVYDQAVDTLQRLEPATPRVKTALRLALQGVDVGGTTNLSGGWLTGCDELGRDLPAPGAADRGPSRIRRALLLTDGLANVGITDPTELTTHAAELRRRGVGTTTLGVGLDFDEVLLSGMAEAGGGNFQFIGHARELRSFFERELGELLTVAAAGLTLALTLPPGVRARLVNAFPTEREGKRIDVALGELPAGDELNLIFALTVAPGSAGTAHPMALAAAWADPATDRRRTLDVPVPPLLLADPAVVAAVTPDPTVAEQAALQQAAAAQREALRLDREGRHAEARARFRHTAAVLSAAPPTAAVQDALAEHRAYAAYDASTGYDEATRKRGTFDALRRSRGKRER